MISWPPDEVERRFAALGIRNRFTEQEKARLNTTQIVYGNDEVIAFPTPESFVGLNILYLRELLGTNPAKQPSFFDHPWYLEEPFGLLNCKPGWHLIYKNVVPESISQPLDYAGSLRPKGLVLPSAIEVVLMLFLHYAGTGEQLLQKKHTWCSDRASMNRSVTVGAFGRNGLFISGHSPEFASRGLGICARVQIDGA
jgi:hypothetical protein